MSYLLAKRKKKRTRDFIILLVLFVLFFLLLDKGYPKFVRNIFVGLDKSVDFSIETRTRKELIYENKLLREENEKLKLISLAYIPLEEENERLTGLLGSSLNLEKDLLVGRVISNYVQSIYGSMIIDVGLDNGVDVGDRIYGQDSILIGEVMEVFDKESKVILYSSYGAEVYGFVSETGAEIKLDGAGVGSYEAFLPRDLDIQEGMTIEGKTRGSILATVVDVVSDPRDPLQHVLFKTPINIYNTIDVGVALN